MPATTATTAARGECKRWYGRLVATGKLDDYRVHDEWFRWKNIAKSFVYIALPLGLFLLALIVYAMVSRLVH